jgi:hypothetical protein
MSRTAEWYTRFAVAEAHGQSAIYEDWATGVALDDEVLAILHELPLPKRQPNLIFATSRLLGAPEADYSLFRAWLLANWATVRDMAAVRSTQTNEPRRCAGLLPVLAGIPGPLALLEVGASAGLCLYPDRYSYSYDGGPLLHPDDGPSRVLLEAETTGGVPIPSSLPTVVWRAGIDIRPLQVGDAEDMRWLRTLIWPEQHARRKRIEDAIQIVSADPPLLIRGDATDALPTLAAQAPPEATLVVINSGTLVYVSRAERARFVDTVLGLNARWVSQEAMAVFPDIQRELPDDPPREGFQFALAVDGHPVAWTGPHGQSIDWIPAH